jgi:predicted transcriptional regulator
MSQDNSTGVDLTSLTADVVSAYVSHNAVTASDLPGFIGVVHAALRGLSAPKPPEAAKPEPAVPVRRSITPEFLISLEDGKHYKSLKRHLARHGLTPAEYRAKWSLPSDYPMVAPSYAAMRSELARSLGLGQQRRKRAGGEPTVITIAAAEPIVVPETAAPKRTRKAPELKVAHEAAAKSRRTRKVPRASA